jgi:hypothetical protein
MIVSEKDNQISPIVRLELSTVYGARDRASEDEDHC